MPLMTWKLIGEASKAAGAVGGQQTDPGHEFFENGLPFRNRFFQGTGLETEAGQHRMLLTAFVGEADHQLKTGPNRRVLVIRRQDSFL